MADLNDLAELLFPDVSETIDDLERKYPPRKLQEGAQVTRFAPSPTGFLHTGSLFTALIGYTLARRSNGVFFFRLEDTDTKRTIAGSGKDLIDQLAVFGLDSDEGYRPEGDIGDYGPYRQSLRKGIYRAVIKELIRRGRAYPDFCTPEDLDRIRAAQEANKALPGYYGIYARDRNLSVDEEIARIKAGTPWVIRYRSQGDHDKKTKFTDAIRGEIELQDNDVDVVILKSDGLPTYHFAHVVDDHFMRTTLITRGEEWIPSTPIHLDMFRALGWKAPKYAHLPVIMKLDHGNKRKLSKRKDPEAAVSYFLDQGYPPEALLVYLMSIANSNFEEWSAANRSYDLSKFPFSLKKMSLDGALFDLAKLNFFSKEIIAREPAASLLPKVKAWAASHDGALFKKIAGGEAYFERILNIEKERKNPRKDYAKYADIEPLVRFFYQGDYERMVAAGLSFNPAFPTGFLAKLLTEFANGMAYGSDEETWWNGVKAIAEKNGFALSGKDYKANPEAYKGSVSDAAEILRVALTCLKQSPNLHEVIEILGEAETKRRLLALAASLAA
ncbi:MAG: glutamate--tRNA ligase [Bacilli bacterium]|jgi:glutamyl-tRNA synthetase|nr:glutamate--tRNA ligase [Bacilli bacterium]